MKQPLLSFNNGEVSPYLRHRTDFEKTGSSAETVENFVCTPYGAITKRPGIMFLANTPAAPANSRLFPFISTDGDRYLLLFTEDLLTILRADGTTADTIAFLTSTSPAATDGTAGFYSAPLREIQIEAINDVLFITHPDTHPLRISRISDTEWTKEFIPFTKPPVLDQNTDESLILSVFSNPIAADWVTATDYDVGNVVLQDGAEWQCTLDHTSDSTTQPGIGASWKGLWRRKLYAVGEPVTINLVNSLPLVNTMYVHDIVQTSGPGFRFIVTTEHTPIGIWNIPNQPFSQEIGYPQNYSQIVGSAAGGGFVGVPPGGYANDGIAAAHVHKNLSLVNAFNSPNTATSTATWLYIKPNTPTTSAWATYTVNATVTAGDYYEYSGQVYRALANMTVAWVSSTATPKNTSGISTITGLPITWNEGLNTDFTDTDLWEPVNFFLPGHGASTDSPGSAWKISPPRDDKDFQISHGALTANNNTGSQPIAVQGNWNVNTYGTWSGTFTVQRSEDNGVTWSTIRSYEAKADRNIADSGTEDVPCLLRLFFVQDGATAASGDQRAVLSPESQSISGYVQADTYVNSAQMTGYALTPLMSGLTTDWAEGAFSTVRGFPSTLAVHESRLAFASTASNPVSLWLSQTDDLLNFEQGAEDTDSLFVTLASPFQYPIRWIESQRRLFIGTATALWVAGSETSDAALTPANFNARTYAATGSSTLRPLLASDSLFFLDRKGSRLNQLNFSAEFEGYEPIDLSRLAEHITQPGILSMAYAQTREPILYAVTREGKLLMFSYSRRDNIMAWTRHSTQLGNFRDVAILPSDDGDDEVFFLIDNRDLATGTGSMLARFPQHWQQIMETGQNPTEPTGAAFPYIYMDGFHAYEQNGVTLAYPTANSGGDTGNATTGLGLFTLTVSSGLAVLTPTTQSGAATTLAVPASGRWMRGFLILSTYKSLPIDMPAQDGATHSGRKRINKVSLSLYRSRGGTLSVNTVQRAIPITANDGILFNGWADTVVDLGHYDDAQLTIAHKEPYPFTVRAALLEMQSTQR